MATEPAHHQPIFERLRDILRPYAQDLAVSLDQPQHYSLDTDRIYKDGKPLFFAAAQVRKNYVSYYLFPVYMFPDLLSGMSPQLEKRMQGKSCFNFRAVDEASFAELSVLTRRGFERFVQEGLI